MNLTKYILPGLLVAMTMAGCKHEEIDILPDAKLMFSSDTIQMGNIFTGEYSALKEFKVYNRNAGGARIDSVSIRNISENDKIEIVVDGYKDDNIRNVVIADNDSAIVYIRVNLAENGVAAATVKNLPVDFYVGKNKSTVMLKAIAQDANRLNDCVITADTRFDSRLPYRITGGLIVNEGATLTLPAGTTLYFNDGALAVSGKLVAEGTPAEPILMTGSRIDDITDKINYQIIPGQWSGVAFFGNSRDNRLSHTVITNVVDGVRLGGNSSGVAELTMVNCRVRNATDMAVMGYDADFTAIGCEFADAAKNVLRLDNCNTVMNHCTVANNYILGIPSDAPIIIDGGSANITNSIIYGIGGDVATMGNADYHISQCLLKLHGDDESRYQSIIWGDDPKFRTLREQYYFDYRLSEGSPAIGAADPTLTRPETATDFYGNSRGSNPDLGAYVFRAE